MDFTLITDSIYNILCYLVLLLIVIGVFKGEMVKVFFSNLKIGLIIKQLLSCYGCYVVKDVKLSNDAGVTKVDYILVSQYGVFVIEKNNIKGRIFGSLNQKKWTRKIENNSNKFINPTLQSDKNTQIIGDYLSVSSKYIYSVILFVGDSTFKTKMPENVTYVGGLIKYIRSKEREIFTKKEMITILNKFENCKFNKEVISNKGKVVRVKSIVKYKKKEIKENDSSIFVLKSLSDSHKIRKVNYVNH